MPLVNYCKGGKLGWNKQGMCFMKLETNLRQMFSVYKIY